MTTLSIRRSDGDSMTLDGRQSRALKPICAGLCYSRETSGYDASRTVWNAMIDRRPAVVVHCAGVNDIKRAVDFARTHGLMTSVKGAGHNIAGSAVCEGGLLDRPFRHAFGPRRSGGACRTCRARSDPRGLRFGGAGLRTCHAPRHQFHDRCRRSHARRWGSDGSRASME